MTEPVRTVSILANRPLRRYLLGSMVSSVGSWMNGVALGWLVLRMTGSAAWVGAVAFAGSLPFLLSPAAGILADRLDRRSVLLASQCVQLLVAACLAAGTAFDLIAIPAIVALVVVNGLGLSFVTSLDQTVVAQLAGQEQMRRGIALNSMQSNLARAVGPALGGLAAAGFGEASVFAINALTFVAVMLPTARLPRLPGGGASAKRPLQDLAAALAFARRHTGIRRVLAMAAASGCFLIPSVTLAPVIARRVLDMDATAAGMIGSAFGLGAAAAAFAHASGLIRNPRRVVLFTSHGLWLGMIAAAWSTDYASTIAAFFVLGSCMTATGVATNAALQASTPEALRGRVTSLFILCLIGFIPLGNLVLGGIAERAETGAALLVAGAGLALVVSLARPHRAVPASPARA
jgi:MFS family permease